MQCSCGADATTKPATYKISRSLTASLLFYECAECKKVSGAVLKINDIVVAEDSGRKAEARIAFNALTIETAEALLHDAIPASPAPADHNTPCGPETQAAFDF